MLYSIWKKGMLTITKCPYKQFDSDCDKLLLEWTLFIDIFATHSETKFLWLSRHMNTLLKSSVTNYLDLCHSQSQSLSHSVNEP